MPDYNSTVVKNWLAADDIQQCPNTFHSPRMDLINFFLAQKVMEELLIANRLKDSLRTTQAGVARSAAILEAAAAFGW
jgi:hypothetical protein